MRCRFFGTWLNIEGIQTSPTQYDASWDEETRFCLLVWLTWRILIIDSTSEHFQDRPDFNVLVAPLKAIPCALPTQPKPYIVAYTPTDYEDVELEDKVVCMLIRLKFICSRVTEKVIQLLLDRFRKSNFRRSTRRWAQGPSPRARKREV